MAKVKKTVSNHDADVEQMELSYIVNKNEKWNTL